MFPCTYTFCCSACHFSNQPLPTESQACCLEGSKIWASQCAGRDTLNMPHTTANAATHSMGQLSHTSTLQPTWISTKQPLAILTCFASVEKAEIQVCKVRFKVCLQLRLSLKKMPVAQSQRAHVLSCRTRPQSHPGPHSKPVLETKPLQPGPSRQGCLPAENPLRPLTTVRPSYSHL